MSRDRGFSAVELLITLFIAASFFIASSQLYQMVIKDGGDNDRRATAYNQVKLYLQTYKPSVGATCTASTPVNNALITVSGLPAPTYVTVDINCPYNTTTPAYNSPTSRVTATINYGSPQQSVKDSVYAP